MIYDYLVLFCRVGGYVPGSFLWSRCRPTYCLTRRATSCACSACSRVTRCCSSDPHLTSRNSVPSSDRTCQNNISCSVLQKMYLRKVVLTLLYLVKENVNVFVYLLILYFLFVFLGLPTDDKMIHITRH